MGVIPLGYYACAWSRYYPENIPLGYYAWLTPAGVNHLELLTPNSNKLVMEPTISYNKMDLA